MTYDISLIIFHVSNKNQDGALNFIPNLLLNFPPIILIFKSNIKILASNWILLYYQIYTILIPALNIRYPMYPHDDVILLTFFKLFNLNLFCQSRIIGFLTFGIYTLSIIFQSSLFIINLKVIFYLQSLILHTLLRFLFDNRNNCLFNKII